MEEKAIEILNILNDNGYESYIVGGYPRDKILGNKTNDIDICTSATPKDILGIFKNVIISDIKYGSVVVAYKGYRFDVTTFRKEIKYEDNRKPIKIKYIKKIKKDLLRRDFTINTLCIDKNGEIIDLLEVKEDLEKQILRTVGNPKYKIKEDALRILRCIRFATILDFQIDAKTTHYLSKYSYLLKKLSMNRKKEELDKIFSSKNKEKGIKLLNELNLTNSLDISNLINIVPCTDLIGIWCQLQVDDVYPFTKLEKEQMIRLRKLLCHDSINNYLLYKYGLYLCTVYSDIKGISKRKLNKMYAELPIKTKKEIDINAMDIAKILNKKPGKYIKEIISDLEKNILNNNIKNNKEEIKQFIINNYS